MILYSTHCPKCEVLETKLRQGGFEYTVCDDHNEMIRLGFDEVPMLKHEGVIYNFGAAVKLLKELGGNK